MTESGKKLNHMMTGGLIVQYRPKDPRIRNGAAGEELKGMKFGKRVLYISGLGINGIADGYTGEGGISIIPNTAEANLDIRVLYELKILLEDSAESVIVVVVFAIGIFC